jgi:hypothetical protein
MARKKGSGRTKGAGSFVRVHLRELNRCLRDDASVIVNRRYAELIGLDNDSFKATTENIQTAAAQIEVVEHDLDESTPIGIKSEEW